MTEFTGVKILVVEDEAIVAIMIEGMLEALGCEIVSSVARVAQACEIAAKANINVALLDVNVAGVPVFLVAEVLRRRESRSCSALAMAQAAYPASSPAIRFWASHFRRRSCNKNLRSQLRGLE